MLDPAVVKASYYCDAIMTPCLCKVVMFSQITRCTVDFWHDTSFSHFPFLRHLYSLTIAAGAHFPTKWFPFCHFTRVQLAEAEKKRSMQSSSPAIVTQLFNRIWWNSWGVVVGDGAGNNIFISLHTDVFCPRKAEYGNGTCCPVSVYWFWCGGTKSKRGIWEEIWSLWRKQGASFHSWFWYRLTGSPRPRHSFRRWFS